MASLFLVGFLLDSTNGQTARFDYLFPPIGAPPTFAKVTSIILCIFFDYAFVGRLLPNVHCAVNFPFELETPPFSQK